MYIIITTLLFLAASAWLWSHREEILCARRFVLWACTYHDINWMDGFRIKWTGQGYVVRWELDLQVTSLFCMQGQLENLCLRGTCVYLISLFSGLSSCRNSCHMRQLLDSWSKFCPEKFFALWWSRILFFQAHMCSHANPTFTAESLRALPTELGCLGPLQKSCPTESGRPVFCMRESSMDLCWRCACPSVAFSSCWPGKLVQRSTWFSFLRSDISVKRIILSIEKHKLICIFTAYFQGLCSSMLVFWTVILLWLFS